ncbi:hypothetical protein ACQ4PT_006457 [Festuca glaucescens]
MTNSTLDSPPQLPAAGAWGSLFTVQKPAKSPNMSAVPPPSANKKPAYGVKRNLEMCTEALGCETGGVDTTAYDSADEGAARKRHARQEEAEEMKVEPMQRKVRVLPPPLTTLAAGASRTRMVHERRGGRLEVYAVRASGMEADRSSGRLRLRFHPCDGCNAAVCSGDQEPREAEEDEAEEVDQQPETECVVAKYAPRGRCLKVESGATAFRVAIT